MSMLYQMLIEFMDHVHVYLPYAGITELGQLVLNAAGLLVHISNFVEITRDSRAIEIEGASVRDFGRSQEYREARRMVWYGKMGEYSRLGAQLTLLVNSGISLFQVPPPPDFFSELTGPLVNAWLRGHTCLALVSICLMADSLIARNGRQWLRQRAQRAVQAGDALPSDAPLFEQLGGEVALDGIVADLYARLLRDRVLSPYFVGVNVKRLEHAQASMMSALLGGPAAAVDLRDAHAHLAIPDAHFTRLAGHLRESLQMFGVSAELIERVLGMVESTRPKIVTPRAGDDRQETA